MISGSEFHKHEKALVDSYSQTPKKSADTGRGARASASCYSLIRTVKVHGLQPAAYILRVIEHIAEADTPGKLDRLLLWNVDLANASANTTPTE